MDAEEKLKDAAQTAADVALASGQGILQGVLIMIIPLVLGGIALGFTIRAVNSTARLVAGGNM
mgnify:FL=1|tara:strand:- start:215 stop:403 length:189 start_codon:yes stop_codon:yes gene_type:complete